jgi:hypothetical protein
VGIILKGPRGVRAPWDSFSIGSDVSQHYAFDSINFHQRKEETIYNREDWLLVSYSTT